MATWTCHAKVLELRRAGRGESEAGPLRFGDRTHGISWRSETCSTVAISEGVLDRLIEPALRRQYGSEHRRRIILHTASTFTACLSRTSPSLKVLKNPRTWQ